MIGVDEEGKPATLVLDHLTRPPEVRFSSASIDWYTPREIVDAARAVMGGIELDFASCEEANRTVKAERYYTQEQDALRQDWRCRSGWLNMPYGKSEDDNKSNQGRWSARLIYEHNRGAVAEACMLVNAATANVWFRPLWAFPLCFIDGRIHFVAPSDQPVKNQPTHSSVVTYLGPNHDRFAEVFASLGTVVLPIQVVRARAQRALEF